MLFELQFNNPIVNLGKRNGEWCIGREVQDKIGRQSPQPLFLFVGPDPYEGS